ncbi:hypothetical protein CJU90_3204 [Yarrowia sp. C11]|nr:hypothetical protein CKK34_4652 [Yarrowia sp. E02]KAG5369701.1 hypothetical protein CJU90_3204 [Yarrowia sp. C11]
MNRAKSSSSLKAKDSPEKPRRSVSILHLPDRENDHLHRHSSVEKLPDLLRTGIRTGQRMSREYSEGVEGGLWRVASGDDMGLSLDLSAQLPAAVRSRSRGSRPGSHGNSRSGSRAGSRAPNSRIHSRSKLALNLDKNVLDHYPNQHNVFLRTPGVDEAGAQGVKGNENSTFFIDATDNYDSEDEEYDYVFNPNNDDEILLRTHIDRYDEDDDSTNFSTGLYRTFAKIMDKIAGIDDKGYDLHEAVASRNEHTVKPLKVASRRKSGVSFSTSPKPQPISSRQARFLVRDGAQKQKADVVMVLGAIEHVFG